MNESEKLKTVIEFMEYIFIVNNTDDLLKKTSEFFVQIFKLANCFIQVEDKSLRYYTNTDLEKSYRPVEKAITAIVKDLKTPLSFDDLRKDPLTEKIVNIDNVPQSTFVVPFIYEKTFLGSMSLYSEKTLKESSELINKISAKFLKAYVMLKKQDLIQQSSVTDELTGLFNRKYLNNYLKRTITRAKESNIPTSTMIFDVDNFKNFNDTKGHLEGDNLLKTIGKIVNEVFRYKDVACRYGGEEFVVILENTDHNTAVKRSEELRTKIKEETGETISIGLITCTNSSLGANEMLSKADEALYKAKRTGKDRVVSFVSVDKALGVIDTEHT